MVELEGKNLVFSFPEVHPEAKLGVEFQRTLRIPDDDRDYPLPPGLGTFPLEHVDDHSERLPESWLRRGGVMLPMYQSEALWVNFTPSANWERACRGYPFAVKIAAGAISAVTGDQWKNELNRKEQDHLAIPEQPWLDGFCVGEGFIRQFVAMPLGSGYSAEEQITGEAEYGGIQIIVYPMRGEEYEKRFPKRKQPEILRLRACRMEQIDLCASPAENRLFDMGLAPGGRMRQTIEEDPFPIDVYDQTQSSRCFVHLANSLAWREITGKEPPPTPATVGEYNRRGLPWFEWYGSDTKALQAKDKLVSLKSVNTIGQQKGDVPLPGNQSFDDSEVPVRRVGRRQPHKRPVREGTM